jgi:hypothetical protein
MRKFLLNWDPSFSFGGRSKQTTVVQFHSNPTVLDANQGADVKIQVLFCVPCSGWSIFQVGSSGFLP